MVYKTMLVNENGEIHKGGRMVCRLCGNFGGFKVFKFRRGNNSAKWFNRLECIGCGSIERHDLNTGKILLQKFNPLARRIAMGLETF